MSKQCKYTHDTTGNLYDDMPTDEWRCPHGTQESTERCPFHANATDGSITEELLDLIESTSGPVRLIGAQIGAIDFDYQTIDGPSNHPIDLREASINGCVSGNDAIINRPMDLRGAELSDKVDFEGAQLNRRVDFGHAVFNGYVTLRLADVDGWFDLREASFNDVFFARVATFEHGIYAEDAEFNAPVDFKNAKFEDVVNFCSADFGAGVIFERAEFMHNLQLNECSFCELSSRPDSVAKSSIPQSGPTEGIAIALGDVRCQRGISILASTFAADVSLRGSQVAGSLRTRDCKATKGKTTVDCTGVEIISGEIETGGDISYDLTDAVVGDLSLSHPEHITSLRLIDARFDGFRFDLLKSELRSNNWRLHRSEDERQLSPEELENLYLRAKNGAKEIGATDAAAEFFIKQMRYRRVSHRQQVISGNGIVDRGKSFISWGGNVILFLTCGYGERPLQPVAFSAGIIAAYAVIFALAGVTIPYATPHGYVTFSIEGFVSLLLGQPETTNTVLSFMIVSESFFGASMIALLVFTLTRSISR